MRNQPIAIVRACGNQRRFSFYNARLIARSRNRCTWACCIYRRTHSPPLRALARFMRAILSLSLARPSNQPGAPVIPGSGVAVIGTRGTDSLSLSLSLSTPTRCVCARAIAARGRLIFRERERDEARVSIIL